MPTTQRLSPAGGIVRGALAVYLAPRLAADAAMPDLRSVLLGSTAANRVTQLAGIASSVRSLMAGRLAKDADLEDLGEMLEAIAKVTDGEREMDDDGEDGMEPSAAIPMAAPEETEDEDPVIAKVREFCKGKLSPEDCARLDEMLGEERREGEDETPEELEAREKREREAKDAAEAEERERRENTVDRKTMDAAIASAIKENDEKHRSLAAAHDKVRPVVGALRGAYDSAPAVFRAALKLRQVDASKVPDAGLEAVWDAIPVAPVDPARPTPRFAADVMPAGVPSPEEMFPGVAVLRRSA